MLQIKLCLYYQHVIFVFVFIFIFCNIYSSKWESALIMCLENKNPIVFFLLNTKLRKTIQMMDMLPLWGLTGFCWHNTLQPVVSQGIVSCDKIMFEERGQRDRVYSRGRLHTSFCCATVGGRFDTDTEPTPKHWTTATL